MKKPESVIAVVGDGLCAVPCFREQRKKQRHWIPDQSLSLTFVIEDLSVDRYFVPLTALSLKGRGCLFWKDL